METKWGRRLAYILLFSFEAVCSRERRTLAFFVLGAFWGVVRALFLNLEGLPCAVDIRAWEGRAAGLV